MNPTDPNQGGAMGGDTMGGQTDPMAGTTPTTTPSEPPVAPPDPSPVAGMPTGGTAEPGAGDVVGTTNTGVAMPGEETPKDESETPAGGMPGAL